MEFVTLNAMLRGEEKKPRKICHLLDAYAISVPSWAEYDVRARQETKWKTTGLCIFWVSVLYPHDHNAYRNLQYTYYQLSFHRSFQYAPILITQNYPYVI